MSCYTTYIFKGKDEDVERLYKSIKALSNDEEGYGVELEDIVDEEGYEVYGVVQNIYYREGKLELVSEDSRTPQLDFVKYIKDKYNLDCLFYGENEYGDIYSNDVNREEFVDLYRLELTVMYDGEEELKRHMLINNKSEEEIEFVVNTINKLEDLIEVPRYFEYEEELVKYLNDRGVSLEDYIKLISYNCEYFIAEISCVEFLGD